MAVTEGSIEETCVKSVIKGITSNVMKGNSCNMDILKRIINKILKMCNIINKTTEEVLLWADISTDGTDLGTLSADDIVNLIYKNNDLRRRINQFINDL